MFFGLVILPSLGLADVASGPFTQVNNYQSKVRNTKKATEIKELCNNIQNFSLNNLGVAYLFDIDEASGEVISAHGSEVSFREGEKTNSKKTIKQYCECLAENGATMGGGGFIFMNACSNIHENYDDILIKMAVNIKQKMQEIQKDIIRNNCNFYNSESEYKASLSEKENDIQNRCDPSNDATINCSSVRGDSRCLMTQQISCLDGNTYVYQTCNRPILENGPNGTLMVKQSTDVCGGIDSNTAVIIDGTNGYLLDDYDRDCVLKK